MGVGDAQNSEDHDVYGDIAVTMTVEIKNPTSRRCWALVSVDILGPDGVGCGDSSGWANGNGHGRGGNGVYNGDGTGPLGGWGNGHIGGVDGGGGQNTDEGALFEVHCDPWGI